MASVPSGTTRRRITGKQNPDTFETIAPPKVRAPDRKASIDDLQQARKELGPAVGQRAFKDYVQRQYGKVPDSVLRDFLRKEPINQVFAAPLNRRAAWSRRAARTTGTWI